MVSGVVGESKQSDKLRCEMKTHRTALNLREECVERANLSRIGEGRSALSTRIEIKYISEQHPIANGEGNLHRVP